MIRTAATRASSLFSSSPLALSLLSLSLWAASGCCHEQQAPVVLPPVQNQEQKVAALDSQLKMAETTGWGSEQERQFSTSMATLPMKVRIDYAHRLARALTYGQIKVRPPVPPPDNAPVCACGGNSCGVPTPAPQPTPGAQPTQTAEPPAATAPSRGERPKK